MSSPKIGKVRPDNPAQLTDFKVLSFDVYSTLVNEHNGMYNSLLPLLEQLPEPKTYIDDKERTLREFHAVEWTLQHENPKLLYPEILAKGYVKFARDLGLDEPGEEEIAKFRTQIPSWPSFPDTIPALHTLHKYYKLILLSNIDNASISKTIANALGGIEFDGVYTAQEIGSYKPDNRNFEYLLKGAEDLLGELEGEGKKVLLHTGQGLESDMVPAKKMGMSSVWIDRDGQEEKYQSLKDEVNFTWRFNTLGEMAEAVEKAFGEKEKKRAD
ncbi:hypothetical protein VTL71DRAFT_1866 [Oculimacula yallundae]|uniref:Haloacid dehalogenase n=1 Tax=Oculimacula yallundae TaxID=86028 RepID=A0ABR4CDV3_9HELO